MLLSRMGGFPAHAVFRRYVCDLVLGAPDVEVTGGAGLEVDGNALVELLAGVRLG